MIRIADMVHHVTIKIAVAAFWAFLLAFGGSATHAMEVRLATSKPDDIFAQSLQHSPALEHAGIKVIVQTVAQDDQVLDGLLNGTTDLGLFALDLLSNRKFDDQPKLFSLFTRPFFFESADQIFNVQHTPVGDAVLADIARAGLVPLSYWNRGLSKIVAKHPLNTPEHFRGLTVASYSTKWAKEYNTQPILHSLGAEPRTTPNVAFELGSGAVGAVLWEPLDDEKSTQADLRKFDFKVYATDFQPLVGILASSLRYWDELSEAEKDAWKVAVIDAAKKTINEIDSREYWSRKNNKVDLINFDREQTLKTVEFVSDKRQFIEDYKLLNDAEIFIYSQAISGKKKSN